MATATARRRRAIEHLIVTDFARTRLRRAAFDVVVDALDLGPMALRTAEDRAWARAAIAGPIREAVDHALGRLVDELIEELAVGRPDLVARILGASGDAWPAAAARSTPVGVAVMQGVRSVATAGETRPRWADPADEHEGGGADPAGDGPTAARVAVLR